MDIDDIKQRTHSFLARNFRSHELREDDDIFALGLVNSLFALQLVTFVEKEFRIAVDNEDLNIDNFRTIRALAGLVARKTSNEQS